MSAPANDGQPPPPAQNRFVFRALLGVALIAVGLLLTLPHPYHKRNFLIDAGGCHLQTTVYAPVGAATPDSAGRGTVVLFHGLAANRKIMSYIAEGFANEGLRVFVPDLPGHGRTEGPFSAARAAECSENLLHELRSRGMAPPERTILAGHSMGGAIAIRVAARVPVAGVIAISPAPMRAAHGVSPDALLFDNPPPLPPNTEIIDGSLEPRQMTANARELLQPARDVNARYEIIPWATHAGLLWRSRVVRVAQDWTARVLRFDERDRASASGELAPNVASNPAPNAARTPLQKLPSRWALAGSLMSLAGLLLIAGLFLREAAGIRAVGTTRILPDRGARAVPRWRASSEVLAASLAAVLLLRFWEPLRLVRLFEGDYLAGFLLCTGVFLIALHWKPFTNICDFGSASAIVAVFAGAVLFLLFSAWFELTMTESWLDRARWERFPLLLIGVIPCLMAEELMLGAPDAKSRWKRVATAMFYRLLVWLPMVYGILFLHSGEILLVMLAPYIAIFSVGQRRGMDVVREVTGSAAAAALFGAILLAGFFLVIFPLL